MCFKNNIKCRTIVEFIVFVLIYGYIIRYCESDMPAHVRIAMDRCTMHDNFSGNFLFYFILNLLSGFSCCRPIMKVLLSFMLAFATTWRINLSKQGLFKNGLFQLSDLWKEIIGISLVFVYVMPLISLNQCWYYGYFVPNIWHNSTLIFLFPFSILLYQKTLDVMNAKNVCFHDIVIISILVAVNVFIKPSFFFILSVAYLVVLFFTYNFTKNFWLGIIPIIVGLFCLGIVYLGIYNKSDDSSYIYFDFTSLLNISTLKDKFFHILISMLFPIFVLICNFKQMKKDSELWLNIIMFLVATGLYLVCNEGGPRASHGNFYWQVVLSCWFWFYFSVKCSLRLWNSHVKRYTLIAIVSLYAASVMFGVVYVLRYLLTGYYI